MMFYKAILCSAAALIVLGTAANAQDASYAAKAAARALPAGMVSGATLIMEKDGKSTTVQKGTNGITCKIGKGDRGNTRNSLAVFCPANSFATSVKQLDALRARSKGKKMDRAAMMAMVKTAMKDGTLQMPKPGSVAYAFRGAGDSWGKDPAKIKGHSWQLISEPMETGKDLGLPEKPEGTMPWVMDSGTPFAHIMVMGKLGMPSTSK